MTKHTRVATIAPRLLMLAAVFFCVLGFALPEKGASASSAPVVASASVGRAAPVTAHAPVTGHAAHAPVAESPQSVVAPVGHDGHGQAAHGTGHDHSFNCMPSASASPTAIAPTPDLVSVLIVEPLALPRSAAVFTPAAPAHPPDLRSLCVQRV